MTSFPGVARAKLFISEYGPVLAVCLAIIGVITIGWAGWIYTHPPTTTVTDNTNKQTIQSTLQTSAVVTGDSALYRQGDRVENQPVYFLSATPDVVLTVQTNVPDEQTVQVDQRIELVMQASHSGEIFWNRSRVLEQEVSTTSDGTVTTMTELNITQLRSQIAPVQAEIGSAGSLTILVSVTASYETNHYSGTLNDQTPLRLSERTYTIDQLTLETIESTPKTREIVVPSRDASAYTLLAGIGVSALLGAGTIAGLYRRREQWGAVRDQLHQNRYAEWISEGRLSAEHGDHHVPVESLENLVDIGIDQSKRVIYDSEREVYAVLDGTFVYHYGGESIWNRNEEE
ncbi:hypothetical protein HUG10_19885 (plasmid) [Halorarum halophilum]|uniref:DUF5305 domain-containing protein n=1 Tax=Halorarum halophilum TaxID=2743090 RepID=A0A7D5H3S0_9EURY|nr:DUF5305 family protein [Halobaculum halophilum]QLG29873.1 hypothetical protein HUG10_19885 [Halobaculum halophilum]